MENLQEKKTVENEGEKQLILKFKLSLIEDFSFLSGTVALFYRSTGNKLSINFNGSKGYLSNVEFSAEGFQKKETNIICMKKFRGKNGKIINDSVSLYYSETEGIIITNKESEVS